MTLYISMFANFPFQIVVVFYVAIVLLLIGTNLRAGGAGRSARFKKHVVEFTEVTSNYLCVYHSNIF